MGVETENGTLCVNTGKFTGRSPKDRFLVKDEYTKDRVWWGRVNKPISPENFDKLYDEVANYLSGKEVFVRDAASKLISARCHHHGIGGRPDRG